ncbi:MAG: DUF1080 domain-containing protein [Candidatus Hydrogenedentota bacterium]
MLQILKGVTCAVMLLTLTAAGGAGAQEVEKGEWIDLFDGETLFGWTVMDDSQWEVDDGILEASGGTGGWLASSGQFMDFELEVVLRLRKKNTTGIVVRSPLDGHYSENDAGVVPLAEPEDSDSPWRTVNVTALEDTIAATVDGEAVEGLSSANRTGHIGIQYHAYRNKVEVKSVRLRPLVLTPIFDGQSLDGWNIIPGRQSKFKVVDGAINIIDGNGQIETDNLYKNFLLQLRIISNGEHLNSGVFFRGPKGVFWKGYESQVRNQWMRDDRTRPVDYGTGGIYGVQAARKVVASDGEWFTKTILCNGNHIAVWIDGYLAADYIDTRAPVDDGNGKAGYVAGPGTIHLQGHDPTTDLSFKDINIQVYP